MRVLQLGGEANLALEPLHVHPGRHLGREDFNHHLPPQADLFGQEHAAHAAAAELALDAVGVT